ncbi:DUF1800 family protein [Xylophilus sp. Kf1]|nr:DUF1800 family protein [Xylophilus sp. Kf1]
MTSAAAPPPISPRCRLAMLGAPFWLAACASGAGAGAAPAPGGRATDWPWLGRVGFLGNASELSELRRQGRAKYLDAQMSTPVAAPPAEPAAVAARIAALPLVSGDDALRAVSLENRRINQLTDADEKQRQRTELFRVGTAATTATQQRFLLRALYAPTQLREQMTWFWMNHFNVFFGKGLIRWYLADYEDRVVRPRVFGRFEDLVMATLMSPAMLEYLDNAQSTTGKVNENYARELMELHTLGVSGGPSGSRYTQQDVQELARVLTGAGIESPTGPPRLNPQRQAQYLQQGLFEFNPNRHDFGTKTFLGERIEGSGFDEVRQAIALLVRQRACAVFVSHKLAVYFVADRPPPALVERMADRFQQSDGNIAAVLKEMFLSPELEAALSAPERRFKDPVQYVVSSLRLAYADRQPTNMAPIIGWLQQLGEPLYGRQTPDGYPLAESSWASSGQLVRRLEIARAIGGGPGALFAAADAPAGSRSPSAGFPLLTNRLYYDQIEPQIGAATRQALLQASSQGEWNAVLLSSPEWMQR